MNKSLLSAVTITVATLLSQTVVCAPVEMECTSMHKPSGQQFGGSGIKWTASARAISACENWVNKYNTTAAADKQYSTKDCAIVSCEPIILDPIGY